MWPLDSNLRPNRPWHMDACVMFILFLSCDSLWGYHAFGSSRRSQQVRDPTAVSGGVRKAWRVLAAYIVKQGRDLTCADWMVSHWYWSQSRHLTDGVCRVCCVYIVDTFSARKCMNLFRWYMWRRRLIDLAGSLGVAFRHLGTPNISSGFRIGSVCPGGEGPSYLSIYIYVFYIFVLVDFKHGRKTWWSGKRREGACLCRWKLLCIFEEVRVFVQVHEWLLTWQEDLNLEPHTQMISDWLACSQIAECGPSCISS